MNKKFIALILTLLIVLSSGVTALASGDFSQSTGVIPIDMPVEVISAVEPNAKVQTLIDRGLVFGDEGGLRLQDEITRAETTAMIIRLLGQENLANTMKTMPSIFSDVPTSNWANGYINVAIGTNLINGYPDKTFKPSNNITNAEITAILVRVIGGIDEPAKSGAAWATPYIIKATETGVLEDVSIKDFSVPATRGDLFEMVYNVIQIREEIKVVGNPIEALVIENGRIGNMNKNTVRVKVLKDQYANEKKGYAEDAEYTLNLDKLQAQDKTGVNLDTEELLGKVILVYFDINNNPVKYEISNQYNYVAGKITNIKADKVEIEGKWYDINIETRREEIKADKELQSSIYNNKQDNFDNFNKSVGLNFDEYVIATVKNGNVLFIEAFDFEDIAPVTSAYNKKTKAIEFVSDRRNGDVDKLTVEDKDAYVLIKSENGLKVSSLEDIKKNDVIHFFKNVDKKVVIVVLKANDAKIEGTFDGVKRTKANSSEFKVEIDKKDVPAVIGTKNFNPVYSKFKSYNNDSFYALTSSYENELRDLYGKKVVAYVDIYGNLQSLSTTEKGARFVGVVTDKFLSEIEVVREDGKIEYYEVTRNTNFVNGNSKNATLSDFNKDDLVRVVVEGDKIVKLEKLTSSERNIIEITRNVVDFNGSYYYVGNNTKLFTFDENEAQLDNLRNFVNEVDTSKALKGYVFVNEKDSRLADIIVITEHSKLKEDNLEEVIVSVDAIRSYGDDYEITTVNSSDNKEFYDIKSKDLKARIKNNEIKIDDIVKFEINRNDKVVDFEVMLSTSSPVFKITEIGRQSSSRLNYVVLEDVNGLKETIYILNKANIFGDYDKNDFVSIGEVDNYNSIELLKVVSTKVITGNWLTEDEIAVVNFVNELKTLPETIKLEDESKVEAVRLSYEALTTEQKALVKLDDYTILTNAETVVADLKAAKEFTDALDLLPTLETLTIDDKPDVEAVRDLYENLTQSQKELVSSVQLDVLIGLEAELVNIDA